MRSFFNSLLVFFFVGCSASSLSAELLDSTFDLNSLRGKKIGYYTGSFDPMHLGHQHVIDSAIERGYVDCVLVYPAPGGDHYKNRSEHALRKEMIARVYLENPNVLVTDWTPIDLQNQFSKVAGELEVIGIIGSDVVTERLVGPDKTLSAKYHKVFMRGMPLAEKHYYDTVGAIMALKADSFVVALRGGVDLSYLDGKIHDRQIIGFISSTGHSSTEVRELIKNNHPFEHLLSFPVQAFIKEKGMYGYPSRFNAALQ